MRPNDSLRSANTLNIADHATENRKRPKIDYAEIGIINFRTLTENQTNQVNYGTNRSHRC